MRGIRCQSKNNPLKVSRSVATPLAIGQKRSSPRPSLFYFTPRNLPDPSSLYLRGERRTTRICGRMIFITVSFSVLSPGIKGFSATLEKGCFMGGWWLLCLKDNKIHRKESLNGFFTKIRHFVWSFLEIEIINFRTKARVGNFLKNTDF